MRIYLLILSMLSIVNLRAQDCETLAPFHEGTEWVIQGYDKKGKEDGLITQKVTKAEMTDSGKLIHVSQEIIDKKEKNVMTGDYTMNCNNGVFHISIESMMNGENMAAFKDMDVTIESEELNFPAIMKPGDQLNDAVMKVNVSTPGMAMMNMTFTVSDRKVEALEEITVGAGTFKCYKISYTTTMKTLMSMEFNGIDWYCPGVGMVKSESYRKGNLTGWQELKSFKN